MLFSSWSVSYQFNYGAQMKDSKHRDKILLLLHGREQNPSAGGEKAAPSAEFYNMFVTI
jgi:hypothetical protein